MLCGFSFRFGLFLFGIRGRLGLSGIGRRLFLLLHRYLLLDLFQLALDALGVIRVVVEVIGSGLVTDHADGLVEDDHVHIIVLFKERNGILERRESVRGRLGRCVGIEGQLLGNESVLFETEHVVRVDIQFQREAAETAADGPFFLAILVHDHLGTIHTAAFDLQSTVYGEGLPERGDCAERHGCHQQHRKG